MIRTGQARPTARIDLHGRPVMKRNQSLSVSLSLLPVKVASFLLSPGGCRSGGDPAQSAVLAVLAAIGRAGDRHCQAQPKDGGSGAYYVNLRQL